MELMEEATASLSTGTGTYTALNELDVANWRQTLEGNGLDPNVLRLDYSPANDLRSKLWQSSQFCKSKGIKLPEFHPCSFGCPLLWNSADSGTKYYGYRVCFGWGKKISICTQNLQISCHKTG